jgi:hypothetical protein
MMRSPPQDRVNTEVKGPTGTDVGDIDRHDDGYTQSDPQYHQQALPDVTRHVPPTDIPQRPGQKAVRGPLDGLIH